MEIDSKLEKKRIIKACQNNADETQWSKKVSRPSEENSPT
jgi:hypothetical protein